MSTIPGTAHSRARARVRDWTAGVAEDPTLVVLSVTIVVVFAAFSIARPDFLSVENVRNIGQQTAVIAIVAVAMTVVIVGRGLDISPGSTVALAGVVGALLLRDGAGTTVALIAVVLAGAGVGVVNGILVGALNVSPFMATLATLAAARGAALMLAGDSGVAVDNGTVGWFGDGRLGPVPVSVVVAALVVLAGWALLNRTEYGRWVRAVGGNPETARASLVPVRSVRAMTYVLTGAAAGIGAVITLGRLGSAQPLAGSGLEFSAITAAVIGGTKLSGGVGGITGTVLGAILVGVISSGLSFLHVAQETTYFVTGGLILIAVLLHRPDLAHALRGAPRMLASGLRGHRRLGSFGSRPEAPRRAVSLTAVGKRFGGVAAVEDVSFDIHAGEVVALMGENGAGKSTLVKMLAGSQPPDSGALLIDGARVALGRPEHARRAGISVIHQHFSLAPDLTVAENVFLGDELKVPGTGLLRRRAMRSRTREILAELQVDVSPAARVGSLGVGQRQMVEVAKALRADAWLLVMDEPTSALSHRERESLYGLVRRLRERGIGVVYISHRMEEVYELASRAVVLRDGKLVGEVPLPETPETSLIAMMVGRKIEQVFPHVEAEPADLALRVRGLADGRLLHAADVDVRSGEVVVLVGLNGSGRSEVLRCLAGISRSTSGTIEVDGRPVSDLTPRGASRLAMAWVPEDRHAAGLIGSMSVEANLTLSWLRRASRWGIVPRAEERELAEDLIERLRVRPPDPRRRVALLSGGNQQKVVLGKALATQPRILLLDEPTRGVDVGAKAEIHGLISELKQRGAAILMVSSELPEALSVADRLVVLHEGRTVAVRERGATEDEIMAYAFGREEVAV
jgi:ABC-type sugar transport system ATPase subunit/ribose/xylose/arabinose/galactoside ABC-type transport system permease subunit